MIRNFIRITLRHLWKNKTYSLLNISGLAIGVICAGFIFLWMEDELQFDSNIPHRDKVYMIKTNQTYQGKTRSFRSSPGSLAAAMKAEIPGVEKTGRVNRGFSLFSAGDKDIYEAGCYADSSILDIFRLPFLQGSMQEAFRQKNSIVITEKMAKRFFGTPEQALGKTLTQEHKSNFLVSGVIADFPLNSTFRPDWLIPYDIYAEGKTYLTVWGANAVDTYVELADNANPAAVNQKLENFIRDRATKTSAQPFLFSANDWHLRDQFEDGKQVGGRIAYVRLFGIIAWIVLLIACINFMNLATARSEKRSREVGVRKVMGAGKSSLTFQFIMESLTMTALAVLVAIACMALLLPLFNTLVEKRLSLNLLAPVHLAFLVAVTLVCGLVAGSYPSFYLSSFNPIGILKGLKMKHSGAAYIRKGLVVFQFTTSIVLIVATIVIYQQIRHVTHRELGYNKEHLLQADVKGDVEKYAVIREELLNTGMVEEAALSSSEMLYTENNSSGFYWDGKAADADILISYRSISSGFFKTWGMTLKDGRDFYQDTDLDSNNVIITASLEKIIGKGSAVGKTIRDDNQTLHIVGVINDYVYGDMYGKSDPVVFYPNPYLAQKIAIRLKANADTEKAMAAVTGIMEKGVPGYPFTYKFVDDQFNALFENELLIGKLSRLFALLAILISCLGIFGLAAYTAEQRVKEIGVRKVLGASITNITTLLSKDFLQLVCIAALIAFPLAWFAMERWLNGYAYRIGISWWVFVIAGVAAILIALVTISFQSIKAAMANPVKSLRAE